MYLLFLSVLYLSIFLIIFLNYKNYSGAFVWTHIFICGVFVQTCQKSQYSTCSQSCISLWTTTLLENGNKGQECFSNRHIWKCSLKGKKLSFQSYRKNLKDTGNDWLFAKLFPMCRHNTGSSVELHIFRWMIISQAKVA